MYRRCVLAGEGCNGAFIQVELNRCAVDWKPEVRLETMFWVAMVIRRRGCLRNSSISGQQMESDTVDRPAQSGIIMSIVSNPLSLFGLSKITISGCFLSAPTVSCSAIPMADSFLLLSDLSTQQTSGWRCVQSCGWLYQRGL